MLINFGRLFRQHCRYHADQTCVVNVERNRRYTFEAYRLLTNRIANMMRSTLGLQRGDTALFIVQNDNVSLLHYPMVFKQEATCAYTNLRDAVDEHLWQVGHIQAKVVFLEADRVDHYYHALRERGCTMVAMDPLAVPREGVLDFWALVNAASDAETGVELDDREHVALLRFTGGTTGRGKCVMYSIDNIMAITDTRLAYMREYSPCRGSRFLSATPLSHGTFGTFAAALMAGGTGYTMNQPDLDAWCKVVEAERITHALLVPTLMYRLLELPGARSADLSSLRALAYGASPISPEKLAALLERFGPIFAQGYGASENFSGMACLEQKDHAAATPRQRQRLGSAGRLVTNVEMKICDDDGNELADGAVGELCFRSRSTVRGYYRNPEATAQEFHGGFWRSGDVGCLDEDGYVYIVDRKKDMIISGGFNVYASEVEAALLSHPSVMQAAAVGVPHPEWGEAVHGEVVLNTGATVSAAELIAHVRQRLGGHKTPKSVSVVGELPTSSAGKVLRRVVREKYWQGRERRVA